MRQLKEQGRAVGVRTNRSAQVLFRDSAIKASTGASAKGAELTIYANPHRHHRGDALPERSRIIHVNTNLAACRS